MRTETRRLTAAAIATNQTFIMDVDVSALANSEILATRCELSGTATQFSFMYNGYFDPKGATLSTLAGSAYTLRVGDNVFTGNFDSKGKIATLYDPADVSKLSPVACKIQFSPTTATMKIKIPKVPSSGQPQTGNTVSAAVVLNMEFLHYQASEALNMAGTNRGGKILARYRIGDGKSASYSGGCQILKAAAIDGAAVAGANKGSPGDSWTIRFMGVPRFGIDSGAASAFPLRDFKTGATPSVNATVELGQNFSQTVTAQIQSVRAIFHTTAAADGVYKLALDGQHFVHGLQTFPIFIDDTGIPQAITVTDPTILRLGLSLTGYSGVCGRIIAPQSRLWQSR